MNVDIRLNPRERYQTNLDDALAIDRDNIDEELSMQAQKFGFWGSLHIAACGLRDDLKRDLDLLEAQLASEIRDPDKKATEKSIKQEVIQNKRYQDLNDRYLEAKRQVDVIYVGREAMTQRKDMLVSLATTLRRERDGDPARHAENITRLEQREREAREDRRGKRGRSD
jgi:hypothetical protein